MKSKLFLFLILVFSVVFAQENKDLKVNYFGYSSILVPTSDDVEEYSFNWSRAGAIVSKEDFSYGLEYDFSKSVLCKSYIQYGKKDMNLQFGKFLTPIAYFFDGPKTLPTPRWEKTISGYSISETGVSGYYNLDFCDDKWEFRLANIEDGLFIVSTKMTGRLDDVLVDGSIAYEQGFGMLTGAGLKANNFLNLKLTASIIEDDDFEYDNIASLRYYAQLPYNLKLYVIVDALQKEYSDLSVQKPLLGLTWEYQKNSFLKVYYEDNFIVEGTFFVNF
jgi:hypothetical protein